MIAWVALAAYLLLAIGTYSVGDPGWSSTGNGNECCHAFLATELVSAGRPALEVTEQLDIELIPLAALEAQALAGTLTAVTSAHAILLAAARLRGRAPRP